MLHNKRDSLTGKITGLSVNHETCNFHKQAVISLSNHTNVGELLSVQHASEKKLNREYLLKIFSNIRYLARQGISLRADSDEKD